MEPQPAECPQGDDGCSLQAELTGDCSPTVGTAEESQLLFAIGSNARKIKPLDGTSPLTRSPRMEPQVPLHFSLQNTPEQMGLEWDSTPMTRSVNSRRPLLHVQADLQGDDTCSPTLAAEHSTVQFLTYDENSLQAKEVDSPIEEENGLPALLSQPPRYAGRSSNRGRGSTNSKERGCSYMYTWLGDPQACPKSGHSLFSCCAVDSASSLNHVRLFVLAGLWFYSAISWVIGAFIIPTLEILVLPGTPFKSFYRRSLVLTLVDLTKEHRYFAVTTLGFFSICVPIAKLLCTAWLIRQLYNSSAEIVYNAHLRKIWALSYFASYQLLDLYVGILFVVHFNSDSSDARFLPGFYWFYSYCMASMLMSVILDGAFHSHARRPGGSKLETSTGEGPPQLSSREEGLQEQTLSFAEDMYSDDTLANARSTCFVSVCFVLLLFASIKYPAFEVHTVWSGISVDRSIHPLFDSVFPNLVKPYVAYTLLFMNIVIPLLYILTLCLGTWHCPRMGSASNVTEIQVEPRSALRGVDFAKLCWPLADLLRPWATTDVLCFATLIFLATVQGEQTKTMPMDGSISYYLFLGAGFSLFFLRWFVGIEGSEREARWCRIPSLKLWIVVAVWALACLVVGGGLSNVTKVVEHDITGKRNGNVVLGAVAANHFRDLNSICNYVTPLVNKSLRKALPAAYGNCSDESSTPPQPCRGNTPLYTHNSGDDFIRAKWLGGLNTVRLDSCHLWKDDPVRTQGAFEATTKYHLSIQGSFDEIKLFLHVRQCKNIPLGGFLGCTRMNSANHCCGNNIHFNVTFGLDCRPSGGLNAFRDILLESFSLDPLIVDTNFLAGSLDIQAFDIAPRVEKLTKHKLTNIMRSAHIKWAGQSMHIPQLLNRLISYNSPDSASFC